MEKKTMNDEFDEKAARNSYWLERAAIKDDPKWVRVDGVQYALAPENATGLFRGHRGRDFYIDFDDGRLIHTTNLWLNGDIPVEFKGELSDNARFLSKEQFYQEVSDRGLDQSAIHFKDNPLTMAEAKIREIKEAKNYRILAPADPGELGLGDDWSLIGSQNIGNWSAWTETQRLAVLADEVPWRGVGEADRMRILGREVDFSQVSKEDMQQILGWDKDRHLQGAVMPNRTSEPDMER